MTRARSTGSGSSSEEVRRLVALVQRGGYKDLVFDLDGTLTLLDMPWRCWIDAVASEIPPEFRDGLRQIMESPGAPWGLALNKHLRSGTLRRDVLVTISRRFESEYLRHTPHQVLIDALPHLKADGASMYVWTGNTRPTAERIMAEIGLSDLFSTVVCREDVLLGKPDLEGWRVLGLAAGDPCCLIVGDSQNDELAAAAARVDYFEITHFKTKLHPAGSTKEAHPR